MKKDKEWLRKESKKHYYLKDLGVSSEPKIMAREIENLIDQLDEPEKVVIPQFVADWIEKNKSGGFSIQESYEANANHDKEKEIYAWLYQEGYKKSNDNQETFARAWLEDYKIEQPKLLTVIVKDYDKTIMSKQMPEDEVNKVMEGLEK